MIYMRLGTQVYLGNDIRNRFQMLTEMGFDNCQLVNWNMELHTEAYASLVRDAAREYGVSITAYWCGWSGPAIWDFIQGPSTSGIVPPAYRKMRIEELKRGADFAGQLGVTDIITHAGFLPESPTDPMYPEVLEALTDLCAYCKKQGLYFLFESGQETPTALLRYIEAIGTGNVGVNLDTANLLLYGKGNPVDALDVIGAYVRGVHAKDGFYPTNGMQLGNEVKIGEGKVDFPRLLSKLKALGYNGAVTIEREISGEQQRRDIMDAKAYLTPFMV